ncbi:IS30 family transposase [Luteibacter pinisoli]|uniref:IS30 family transposase n=1 Tax=Luteibacter pinisoli TaxID=2589080 RepID=A0A4Y5Z1S0_9GAMM|nr:IS30 family transposase [Luteibacter pinisoli]QDE38363.1 IS30 family transposase [Luteibacter pinisoli]QDE39635.1 IS30 family transposase [Luteibacter pinisoli]
MSRTVRLWRHLSTADRERIWTDWQAGVSPKAIARLLERDGALIYYVLSRRGGFAPPPRKRSARTLQLTEREEISRGLCQGHSLRRIAQTLGRAPSSICREVGRNGGRDGYRAAEADQRAWTHALRPKECLLARRGALRRVVASKLAHRWAPQQISGWLARRYPDDDSMRVSHETIYRSLFIQTRGVLKKQLLAHLRTRRSVRYPLAQGRHGRARKGGRSLTPDALRISERPADADDRAVPGHWEGDLLAGTLSSHIVTLVERRSRFVMLIKIPARDSETVVDAVAKHIRRLPAQLRRSLTWDRGPEMSQHQRFKLATNVQVYFCDPHSPWQRGSNENTNGLLRQYFPKGQDLSHYTQAQLNAVAKELNQRPRQTLDFQTPAEVLNQTVASTS